MNLEEILIENPVIAAIRSEKEFEEALLTKAQVVFVLFGSIININSICEKLKSSGKIVFVHIDLIEGLKGDQAGLSFIKEKVNLDGIITTRGNIVKLAKSLNLLVIQRFFIVDSLSLETAIKNSKDSGPQAVEIMPGISRKIINRMKEKITMPIIAGGLIESKKDIIDSINSGAIAISTTSSNLWNE